MSMKNILVTGGAGYIGSIICNYFIKKKLKVFINAIYHLLFNN